MSAPKLDSKLKAREAKARAAKFVLLFGAAGLVVSTGASGRSPEQQRVPAADPVRAVFADHDCCGRLADSDITRVGELRLGSRHLTVYAFWFVNPQSRHGMKHLAIVEGGRFLGSYIISDRSIPRIEGDRVRFGCRDDRGCPASLGDDLVIEDGILPQSLWLDGDVNELGDSI